MKTSMWRFGCALATATLATGAFAAWDPEEPAGDVAIRITTEHTALSLNEPMVVHLHFRNLTSTAMPFNLGVGDEYVAFRVYRPDGRELPVRFGQIRRGCMGGCGDADTRFTLVAGWEHSYPFVLSEWHHFDAVGEYRIVFVLMRGAVVDTWDPDRFDVRLENGIRRRYLRRYLTQEDRAWLGEEVAASNAIAVRVLPRDAEALRTRAEHLLGIVMAEREWWAARALRWMVDPVAIPAWERMVPIHYRARNAAVDGLAALATPAAVEALGRMVDTVNSSGVRNIGSALTRIAETGNEKSATLARAAMEEHANAFSKANEELEIPY